MPYIGDWGTFVHIPKCSGNAMRLYLTHKYGRGKRTEVYFHDFPADDAKNVWCIIRHPVWWLPSVYGAWQKSKKVNGDQRGFLTILPDEVQQLEIVPKFDLTWDKYFDYIVKDRPGIVGKFFNSYLKRCNAYYRLESINVMFPGIKPKNVNHSKPEMSVEQINAIFESESDFIKDYYLDYNNPITIGEIQMRKKGAKR